MVLYVAGHACLSLCLNPLKINIFPLYCSADLSVSALRLLQRSPVFQSDFRPLPPRGPPSSALRRPRAKAHQVIIILRFT